LLNTILGSLSSGVAASTSSYESIASATGTGSSATITFDSIPSGYVSLQIRGRIQYSDANYAGLNLGIRFNNNSSSIYNMHYLFGDGSSRYAQGYINETAIFSPVGAGTGLTNNVGTVILDLLDYTSTTKNKTLRVFGGADTNFTSSNPGYIVLSSGLWVNTAAVTRIDLTTASNGNFTTNTTFALYGIKGA
jgi:hypothetical protein